MNIFLSLIVFGIVFFIYLHIYYHFKCSNDLEIYTIDNVSKEKLEEICDLRQPVLFKFMNNNALSNFKLSNIVHNYGSFDVKIKNNQNVDEIALPISAGNAIKLFNKDNNSKYYTCNNEDFLQETGIKKKLTRNDMFLRPALVSSCKYDYQTGSTNCTTPLQYSLNYRNYLHVVEGSVSIKLIPPIYTKFLYESRDYDNFEFRSPINPWSVQDDYLKSFSKVRLLELEIKEGEIIYIPAYWWYSVQYKKNSALFWFKYRTYMNTVAISPHICISFLQKQNTKFDIVKKLTSSEDKLPSPAKT